ncbi:hypothetical protein Pd630_LPD09037 (plasmid) [Rhodococcus opacus PD630]|nr:hypothetical protein Pd630_LPD09037 [Rhodococcus opacus PD630]
MTSTLQKVLDYVSTTAVDSSPSAITAGHVIASPSAGRRHRTSQSVQPSVRRHDPLADQPRRQNSLSQEAYRFGSTPLRGTCHDLGCGDPVGRRAESLPPSVG